MKYSIRFIRFTFTPTGTAKEIQVLRGMELRTYRLTDRRFYSLSNLCSRSHWSDKFYPTHIDFERKYK